MNANCARFWSYFNKPAIVGSNFSASSAIWRTRRNIRVVFDSLHYVETWRHPQNRKYVTYCIAVRGGLSDSHRWRVQKSSVTFGMFGFWDMRENIQTNVGMSITLIAILCPLWEGGGWSKYLFMPWRHRFNFIFSIKCGDLRYLLRCDI